MMAINPVPFTPASSQPKPRPAFRWLAVGCAVAVSLLGLFAVSSQLHSALHADAGHQDHSCAITLLAAGTDDPLGCEILLVSPAMFSIGEYAPIGTPLVAAAPHLRPPGRAPPLC